MPALRLATIASLTGALLLAGCGSSSNQSSSSSSASSSSGSAPASQGSLSFEGMPLQQGAALASAGTTQTGPVAGITCGPVEQLAYHIHAHLAVYVDGSPRSIPAGVGIPGSAAAQTAEGPVATGGQCIYWLHTHAPDGVVHVESPTARVYTLGDFFEEWHQPLSATQVASASGRVTAYVNGKAWTKDPRTIPLVPHAAIQLDVGTPAIPFQPVSWADTQL